MKEEAIVQFSVSIFNEATVGNNRRVPQTRPVYPVDESWGLPDPAT
jgi:hypothetical protein